MTETVSSPERAYDSPTATPPEFLSLHAQADALLVRIFDLVDQYTNVRTESSQHLSSAFFDLAQSKYAMGPGRLTRLQYDGRMQAGTTITQIDTEMTLTKRPQRPPPSPPSSPDQDSPTLRRRKGGEKGDQDVLSEADDSDSDTKTDSKGMDSNEAAPKTPKPAVAAADRDPLNWFGVLVPPHLRNAQGSFKRSLVNFITLANLINEIEESRANYDQLVKRISEEEVGLQNVGVQDMGM